MKHFIFLVYSSFILFSAQAQLDSTAVHAIYKKLRTFQENDQIDSIWFYETKAMEISKKINYQYGIAHALNSFGVIDRIKGNYPGALNNFYKSLAISEKTKNKQLALGPLSGIASVYYFQRDIKKAKEFYLKAIDLSRELKDKQVESNNLCNLAGVYADEKNYAESESCLMKALALDKEMDNEFGIIHELVDLGLLMNNTKQYLKTEVYVTEAIALAEKLGYAPILPTCYKQLATAYTGLKDYTNAESYYLKAIACQHDDLSEMMQIEIGLSELYQLMGNDTKALDHYKTFTVLSDSIYNVENAKKSVAAEMNYEFEKKQIAVKAEHDRAIDKLEAENKLHRQTRLFMIVFIILVLGLLLVGKRAYDNKKKMAEFMAEENLRKEVLLQEVHHRINNNLQIISSLLTLQANSAENEKLSEYLTQSQNRIQSLSALHELLYDTNSPMNINMKEYVKKVLDFHREMTGSMNKKILIKETIPEINFPTKIAVPVALIINELVTNSIKYAFTDEKEGTITIEMKENNAEKGWEIIISDNGKGLPPESGKRKDSLGLKLVKILTKQIGGTLTSKNENGASFSVIFSDIKKS